MTRLVRNLLVLSALELKECLDLKDITLADLLRSVLDDYEVIFSAKKTGFQADFPPRLEVNGDRDNLQRAVINLIDNAVKYNHEGGQIKLQVSARKKGAGLTLSNTGRGMPALELDQVFVQFYRVEKSRSAEYGGAGLGLAIVKRIIELHGGSISIESEPSAWTRVNIFLPN